MEYGYVSKMVLVEKRGYISRARRDLRNSLFSRPSLCSKPMEGGIDVNNTMRIASFILGCAAPFAVYADAAGLARNCAHCHGLSGHSSAELIPHIAGQKEAYLKAVLLDFKQGKRPSLFMSRLAKGYTDQELDEVATHFARLPWQPGTQATDSESVARGAALAKERCVVCHGGNGAPGNGSAPVLAGQWAAYLKTELGKFIDPQMRVADPGMRTALVGLAAADFEALAQFYASQR